MCLVQDRGILASIVAPIVLAFVFRLFDLANSLQGGSPKRTHSIAP